RQLDVGQMDRVTYVEIAQIDLNKLRQIGWQTGDVQLGNNVADNAAVQFDCRRDITVDEVYRHFDVNLLGRINALEFSMQNELLVCVNLEIAQQYFFNLAIDFEIEDRRVENFFFQCVVQRIVIERDIDWCGGAAINDTWGQACIALAAARSG